MSTSIQFHETRLDNGLTIVAETNDQAHTAAVGFFVRTGSRDEQKPLMGVSHFLEHMMFKGTAERTADDVNRQFDDIGANYNAYTSQENTVYYAQVLPEYLGNAVDLFGDMLRPALRTEDFDMEKNVILEEIGMYDDRPYWRLNDALLEAYFGNHPLGYRVLGTADSIKALTADQMRGYFDQRYSPDNITVAAAGQLDFDALVADVTKRAATWKPTDAARTFGETAVKEQRLALTDAKLTRHYVAAMWAGPDAQDDRRYAAAILADLLGDTDGSRLYWALIDPGLCDEADMSHHPQDRLGNYVAYAACDPKRAEQVEQVLLETLDDCVGDIDASEVERAKNKLATAATLSGERPGGRMRGLGSQWTYLGQYIPLADEIERMMAVTVDDVAALLEDFPFTPRVIATLGPR